MSSTAHHHNFDWNRTNYYFKTKLITKISDINQCEWQLKDGSHKTRQLTFTVLTGQSIGPKTAQVTETQVLSFKSHNTPIVYPCMDYTHSASYISFQNLNMLQIITVSSLYHHEK